MRRILRLWALTAAAVTLLCLWSSPALAQTVLVQPYVQPGDGRSLTGTDVKVICWLTDQKPGEFVVEFNTPGGPVRTATPARVALDFPALKTSKKDSDPKKKDDPAKKKDVDDPPVPPQPEKDQRYYKYTAHLDQLPFNSDVRYRVKLGGQVVREATFRSRATADKTVRCVLVGDMAQGRPEQNAIAYHISKQNPEFLVALGDIVYPGGRVSEYMRFYWGTYNNVTESGLKTGAPLMASVPFYAVLGNHDVNAKLPNTPDAFGAYYFFSSPKNGPGEGPWATKLGNNEAVAAKFRAATADSYPYLDAYSFDYGPAHFAVLNVNAGMNIDAPAFRKWLTDDLKAAKGQWKIVCFHQPGFHSSKQHYAEQQVRPLQPLMEECGVTLAFAGHVHNYQRSVPLKFAPEPKKDKKGRFNGQFTLDNAFDGAKNTVPSGVIHVVAGGGGASLYGPGLEKTAPQLKKDHGDNYADYTTKMVVTDHSFVTLDLSPDRIEYKALNGKGAEIDRITITKKK